MASASGLQLQGLDDLPSSRQSPRDTPAQTTKFCLERPDSGSHASIKRQQQHPQLQRQAAPLLNAVVQQKRSSTEQQHSGGSSKPSTPSNSQQQQQHWPTGGHLPQRPAWECSVAAVWGKPKPSELQPAGSPGAAGMVGVAGPGHADTSHWSSMPARSGSDVVAASTSAAAADGVDASHWAPSLVKTNSMSPASRTVSSSDSPHRQHQAPEMQSQGLRRTSSSSGAQGPAACSLTDGAAAAASSAVPGSGAAGVKRQLPLGSLDDVAADVAATDCWWAGVSHPPAAAADAGSAGVQAAQAAGAQMQALHITEVGMCSWD